MESTTHPARRIYASAFPNGPFGGRGFVHDFETNSEWREIPVEHSAYDWLVDTLRQNGHEPPTTPCERLTCMLREADGSYFAGWWEGRGVALVGYGESMFTTAEFWINDNARFSDVWERVEMEREHNGERCLEVSM